MVCKLYLNKLFVRFQKKIKKESDIGYVRADLATQGCHQNLLTIHPSHATLITKVSMRLLKL